MEALLVEDFLHVEAGEVEHFDGFAFVDEEVLHLPVEAHEVQLELRAEELLRAEEVLLAAALPPEKAAEAGLLCAEGARVNGPVFDEVEHVGVAAVDFEEHRVQPHARDFEGVLRAQVDLHQEDFVARVFEGQQVEPLQRRAEDFAVDAQLLELGNRAQLADLDGPGQPTF